MTLMILAALTIAAVTRDEITHPMPGSPVRKQVLDSIRPFTYAKDLSKIKFLVPYMAVKGNQALVYCSTEDPEAIDKGPFATMGELTACFVVKKGSKWKPIGFIKDPHEGIVPGTAFVIDLRPAVKLGFTKEMFPPNANDMTMSLGILGDVRRLGFTYGWFIVKDVTEIVAVSPKEIDAAKKLKGGQILIRGAKADVFRPEL